MASFPQGLEPTLIWQHFERICGIPHGSGNEAALRASLIEWAKSSGFEYRVDAVGNMVVVVPATPGCEGRQTTVIQGHIDMVCEKNSDSDFNFATDGLNVVIEDGFVTAVGTTLGADNGIGVAAGMAIANDPEAVHGPLELLCTIDEERGMTGAFGLQPGFITATRMLNLDTEEEGALYVGCSGGGDVNTAWALARAAAPSDFVGARITVNGLMGGHSGLDIHLNRANAIKCLARVLWAAQGAGVDLRLARIEGGSMRNALPREAWAELLVAPGDQATLAGVIEAQGAELSAAFKRTDPSLSVQMVAADVAASAALTGDLGTRIVGALMANPSSVISMSPDVVGLVETSNNLGVIKTTAEAIEVVNCTRSSKGSDLEALRQSIAAIYALAGATLELEPSYPGWLPNLESPMLKQVQAVHQEVFGKAAEIKAIHAGLECGLIGRAFPELDMISMGPDILGAHSPSERLSIESTGHFYELVRATLAALD
jgi:dipeptidase D